MTTTSAGIGGRFYRDADRAILGGVCAGLAGYFGFNLKATRFLAFIAFIVAMPAAVIAYLAAVILIPSESNLDYGEYAVRNKRKVRGRDKRSREEDAVQFRKATYTDVINRRCRTLDERLARLEKHVTSRRFQLDQELRRL